MYILAWRYHYCGKRLSQISSHKYLLNYLNLSRAPFHCWCKGNLQAIEAANHITLMRCQEMICENGTMLSLSWVRPGWTHSVDTKPTWLRKRALAELSFVTFQWDLASSFWSVSHNECERFHQVFGEMMPFREDRHLTSDIWRAGKGVK